jgi:hypothetical protein
VGLTLEIAGALEITDLLWQCDDDGSPIPVPGLCGTLPADRDVSTSAMHLAVICYRQTAAGDQTPEL